MSFFIKRHNPSQLNPGKTIENHNSFRIDLSTAVEEVVIAVTYHMICLMMSLFMRTS